MDLDSLTLNPCSNKTPANFSHFLTLFEEESNTLRKLKFLGIRNTYVLGYLD